MNYFMPLVEQYLNQSSVGLYWTIDNRNDITLNGFLGSGLVVGNVGDPTIDTDDTDDPTWTALSQRIVDENWAGNINVFLVQNVTVFSTTGDISLGGITLLELPNQRGGRVVALADADFAVQGNPGRNHMYLAHELIHAIGGQRDIYYPNQIAGIINNVRPIFGDPQPVSNPNNPMNWNLMRQTFLGRRHDPFTLKLTEGQTLQTWTRAKAHYAWHGRD